MTQTEGQLAYRWQRDFDKQGAFKFFFLTKDAFSFVKIKLSWFSFQCLSMSLQHITDAHWKPTNINEYAIEKSERWRSQNSLTVIASSRHHSQLNLPEKTDSHKKKTHN